jgi:mRNA interferase MazF
VRLGRGTGREQAASRYAVVVQSDELWLLSTVVVVPTSASARPATFRPEIVVAGERTRVLCEQIRTVDPQRLCEAVATLSAAELRGVEDAIEIVLGL